MYYSLIAHFAQLHQQIHKLFILYNGRLAKLDGQRHSIHTAVLSTLALSKLVGQMGHDFHPALIFGSVLNLSSKNLFQVKGIHSRKKSIGPKPLGFGHGNEDSQFLTRWYAHFDGCLGATKHYGSEKILSRFEEGEGVHPTRKIERVFEEPFRCRREDIRIEPTKQTP